MRKYFLLLVSVTLLNSLYVSFAQKKTFTFNDIFRAGSSLNITKPLPNIGEWIDDDNYLELQTDAAGNKIRLSVDAKSGKSTLFNGQLSVKPGISSIKIEGAQNITTSPDGKWVAYTKANNLYAQEMSSGKVIQFTNDGSETILNGYASWVYYEEILGRASRYKAFWWSNNSKQLAFMRFDESQVPVFPIYVADGQHGYLEKQRYPKAGDKNPEVKIGIAHVDKGNVTWADFNEKDDQYFGTPVWTPANALWIQWMNRDQNNLKIYEVSDNGSKKEVYDEKQQTWIVLDEDDRIRFVNDNKQFIVKSDKDGWSHLYLYNADGSFVNQITQGDYTVTDIEFVNEKAKEIYFKARKENSARFDLYKVQFSGKGLTRLTFGEYSHDNINVSPDGKYFITTYSNLATPPQMALVDNKGRIVRELGDSKGANFDNYLLPRKDLVRVKSGDGLFDLPVAITYPVNFDPAKKYPVLVSIYGGPNAGSVYDRWKAAGGTTQWWAQEGLVQVSFDNRSSGHFGKKGMNYIYRQLGKYEIEDYMTCARWLKNQPWVDGNKLCITGGSFGGYMTCMALTYGAEVFDYGIADASVTDWQLYDSHYTERFMDTPKDNPEGYKNTAVLTYANKYKGMLRIVHGTTDDNVHMQNSLQLVNKLEDLKKDFELMVYPNERHGIGGNVPAKRTHNMLESFKFYYKNLLNKPMPDEFWK